MMLFYDRNDTIKKIKSLKRYKSFDEYLKFVNSIIKKYKQQ